MRSQSLATQPLADEDVGDPRSATAFSRMPQTEEEWRRFVEDRVFGGGPIRYSKATTERAAALLVPRP